MAIIIKNFEVAGIVTCGDDFESGKVRGFGTAVLNEAVINKAVIDIGNNKKTKESKKLGLDGDEMIV
ncbi:MAG: hypothetical protein RSE00_00685 [Clostridia bacterium]